MHDQSPRPSPNTPIWGGRLASVCVAGLLAGIVLLASVYLWSTRESHTARPVDVVTLRAPMHAFSTNGELVPVQLGIEFDAPPCPTAETGQLCLVIGSGNATPDPITFT